MNRLEAPSLRRAPGSAGGPAKPVARRLPRWANAAGLVLLATAVSAQERPQLDAAAAARQRIADYLAQGREPWLPPGAVDGAGNAADFTVAADGSGTHTSVQAAVDAVPSRGAAGQRRHVVAIRPGVYRELVCVKDKAPLSLIGSEHDPSAVVIVEGRYNGQARRPGADAANPCDPATAAATVGTPGSASVALFSDDVHVAHLTLANDAMAAVRDGRGYPPGAGESGGAQGVALMTEGDRLLLDNVRLVGHQDTLLVRATAGGGRVLVRRSLIAGDVDFIFGNGTLVVDDSTVLSRGGRRTPGNGGHVLAPSTAPGQRLGLLVAGSRFLAEPGVAAGSVSLGRAWDVGVAAGAWQPGTSPNGQALVRDSLLGGHIAMATPWAASTSRRPFSAGGAQAARMAEFANLQLPADAARAVLPVDDGWAAAGGGTTGGAAALTSDVHVVSTRAELVAALAAPHTRPRIVKFAAFIELGGDEADFRDADFDWAAYERDPTPNGPADRARQRSARRQAAHGVLRVPSNTTLIGVAPGAGVGGGMLLLQGVENVIVRHLHFADAFDHFPAWDANDGASGEWNAEYDNLSLRGARRVWIDHNTFDDGRRPDASARRRLGKPVQHHDGLLDITQQSDFVTVSWNHFRDHDKTVLVGSSDRQVLDAGKLNVTFRHNLWQRVKERAPRVRFGRVHLFNNLHLDSGAYAVGLGVGARIVSQGNVWQGELPADRLLRLLGGRQLSDQGSLRNGQPFDLRAGHPQLANAGWQPHLVHGLDGDAAAAAQRVAEQAGARPGRD